MKQSNSMSEFCASMKPFPGLEAFARTMWLPDQEREIFYYDTGEIEKPTALFLHGLGDEADTWRHLIHPIAEHWRVLAPDLPGFGRSDGVKKKYSAEFFTETILEMLSSVDVHRVLLVGHSLGAVLAHKIAQEHPSMARGIVLIDGSPLMKTAGLKLSTLLFLIPWLGERMYEGLRKDPLAAYKSLQPYYADIEKLPIPDRDFLYQRVNQRVWSDKQQAAYFSTLRNFALQAVRQSQSLRDRLEKFNIPTLIFWGEEDQVYSPEGGLELSRLQPDTRTRLASWGGTQRTSGKTGCHY